MIDQITLPPPPRLGLDRTPWRRRSFSLCLDVLTRLDSWSNFATLFGAVYQGWNYPWFVFKYDKNNDRDPEIFTTLGQVQTFLDSDEPRAKAHRRVLENRKNQAEADVEEKEEKEEVRQERLEGRRAPAGRRNTEKDKG